MSSVREEKELLPTCGGRGEGREGGREGDGGWGGVCVVVVCGWVEWGWDEGRGELGRPAVRGLVCAWWWWCEVRQVSHVCCARCDDKCV